MTKAPSIALTTAEWTTVSGILDDHVPDLEVWAFGSRVTGTARPYSDLDLVLVAEEPVGLATLAALGEAFTDSDLPWKVDIVDWSRVSDALRDEVRRHRVVLQSTVEGKRIQQPG